MNKNLSILIILFFLATGNILGQSVLNPADTLVNYNGSNEPTKPPSNQIGKWMRTKSLSWNTDSFKAYIYNGCAFRLRFPKSYVPGVNDGKLYPMIIVFHGGGESGPITDNETQLFNGAPLLSADADNGSYDGYLLFMQSPGKWGGNQYTYLTQIADYMVTNNKLDPFRISVSGLSSGGQAAWEMALFNTNYVASSTPMSYVSIGYQDTSVVNQVKFMPVWNFQGGLDGSPAPYTAQQVRNAMLAAGGNYTYTEYPTLAHGVWNAAFTDPNFLPFVLNAYQSNPWTLFGRTGFCPGTSINVTIGLSRGFNGYQWRKNGVLLSNTTNTINVTDTGTYDARVLRGTRWSDWSHVPAVIHIQGPTITPPITVSGLMSDVIPAADGKNYVNLQIPNNNYTSYTWKKVGSDSVIGTQQILQVNQPGSYIVSATEKYGCSSIYSPPFGVYNANGNAPPSPAANLVATTLSNSSIELDWSQNPKPNYQETGFEIYRGTTSGGPYTFAGLVPADTVIFKDNNLSPNVTYYYKVRTVNNNGAAALSNETSATTQSDKTPPSAPPNLILNFTTESSISVSWDSASDNVGVVAYDIFANGIKVTSTTQTSAIINGVQPKQQYIIVVKARDAAGNSSPQSNQVVAITTFQGLLYKYYEGSWNQLPDFTLLTPVASGISSNTSLSVKLRSFQYGILWQGYIKIPVTGTYTFGTTSDDGSKLWLSTYQPQTTPLVNNDGIHLANYKNGTPIKLNAGIYPISIAYFQNSAQAAMNVFWKCKNLFGDGNKHPIDNQYFSTDSSFGVGNVPTQPGTVTLTPVSFDKINISWVDSSNNETGFAIYRSNLGVGPFNIIYTTGPNVTSYTDSGLTASTRYFYKIYAFNNSGNSDTTLKISAVTKVVPQPPAAATNLNAIATSSSTISLSWQDNGVNETGYKVYRSENDTTHFRIIGSIPAYSNSYMDSSLFANLKYYYKVMVTGSGGSFKYSFIASTTTKDNAPIITKITTLAVPYGVSTTIPITASDVDGDSLYFQSSNLRAFASLVDNHNKTASLILNPASTDQGNYSSNEIYVYDGYGGVDSTIFQITVNNNYIPTIDSIANYTMYENDNISINLSAHDQNSTDTLTWSVSNLPNNYTLIPGANGFATLKLHPNYAAAGTYIISVTVSDGHGGVCTRKFNLTVNDKNPSPIVYIRFQDQDAIGAPWNGIAHDTTNNLTDNSGVNTGIGLDLETSWWATYHQGPNTGNNSGVYPDAVLKDYYYFGIFGGPNTVTAKLTGLDTSTLYSFNFYAGSLYSGVSDNGNTTYTIGNQTVSLYVQNNINNTVSIDSIKPASDGTISFTMAKAANASVGYINALVVTAAYNDGSIPLAPQSLTAQAVPAGIALSWKDVAYNETGYAVYRSTSATGTFSLIKTIPVPNTTSFTDSSINGTTTYYYEVQALSTQGNSAFSNIASATTLDRIPKVNPIANVVIRNNQSLQVQVSAVDDSTDHLTLVATNLPTFVTFTDNGNGTGLLNINPVNGMIGGFSGITITATDNSNASNSTSFDITVIDSASASVYLNFTTNILADKPWNNLAGTPSTGITFNNLVDDSNNPTTLSVSMPDGFQGVSASGMIQGNGKGIYSDSVMEAGEYEGSNNARRIVVTGLANTKQYNFVFFSSHNDGTNCLTHFTINNQTVSLNATYNINKTVQINGISPDSTGTVTISVQKDSTASDAIISALVIQSYDSTAFLSPADLRVTASTTSSISLQWEDRDVNEGGFQIWRASDTSSTYSLIKTVPANSTSFIDSNLLSNHTYYYVVRAAYKGNFSSYSNVAAGHTYSYAVYVNFTNDNDSPTPWNNTNQLPQYGLVLNNFYDATGFPTGMGLNVTGLFDGLYTAGMSTGNNSGVVPDKVMADSYGLFTGNTSSIKITGLNYNLKYDFTFFASANSPGDVNSIYTIGNKTAIINASYNTSGTVTIYDVVPDSTGSVNITIAPDGYNSQFGLIGALIVQGYTPTNSQAPALPITSPKKSKEKDNLMAPKENAPIAETHTEPLRAIGAYPNPFKNNFTLTIPAKINDDAAVIIYNAAGKLCYQNTFENLNEGDNTIKIEANGNFDASGIYFVKVFYKKSQQTQTIEVIKMK